MKKKQLRLGTGDWGVRGGSIGDLTSLCSENKTH